jgi:hypothetical protein
MIYKITNSSNNHQIRNGVYWCLNALFGEFGSLKSNDRQISYAQNGLYLTYFFEVLLESSILINPSSRESLIIRDAIAEFLKSI